MKGEGTPVSPLLSSSFILHPSSLLLAAAPAATRPATEPADKAVPILVKLAERYDGQDRWYLEALGIGATGKEEQFLQAWSASHKETTPASEKLAWRMKKVDPTAKPAEKTAGTGGPRADAAGAEGRRPF